MNSALACAIDLSSPQSWWTSVMTFIGDFLSPLSSGLIGWLGGALFFGSLLALATWALTRTVLRSARPGLHVALWLIVLLKFVVPIGPAWNLSLESGLRALGATWNAPPPAPPTHPANGTGVSLMAIPNGLANTDANPVSASIPESNFAMPDPIVLIALAYLLGVLIIAGVRILAYRRFAARCRALPAADDETRDVVAGVCRRLGVRRVPDVRICDDAPAPFLLGAWRPLLVLSRRQMSSAAELEAVVLHEIAHLHRGDLVVRYLQWLAGTCLFFWPVVAWVNRRIDLAREHICDEWALRHGKLSAGAYARTLLSAVSPATPRLTAYAPTAMAANRSHIERRIEMILTMRRASASMRSLGILGGLLVAGWAAFALTSANAMLPKPCPPEGNEPATIVQEGETAVVVIADDSSDGATPEMFDLPLGDDGPIFMLDALGQQTAGDFQKQVLFIASPGGAGMGSADGGDVLWVQQVTPSTQTMKQVREKNPSVDLDGNGELSRTEFDAYLTALAMTDPAAVLMKYPHADRDGDGRLSAGEAARLINTNGMPPLPSKRPLPDGVTLENGELRYTVQSGDTLDSIATKVLGDAGRAVELSDLNKDMMSDGATLKPGTSLHLPKRLSTRVEMRHEVHMLKARAPIKEGQPAEITIRTTTTKDGQTETTTETGDVARQRVQMMNHPEPLGTWLIQNVTGEPTADQIRSIVPIVADAPLALFLEHNPAADANGDGKLTQEERDTYMQQRQSRMRARVLEKHPEADADHDGVLSEDEFRAFFKSRHAAGGFGAGPDGARRVVVQKSVGDSGETQVNVEVKKTDEETTGRK